MRKTSPTPRIRAEEWKELRDAWPGTPQELAELLGCHRVTLRRYGASREPTFEWVELAISKLAKVASQNRRKSDWKPFCELVARFRARP